jgi:hypothetical protein
MNLPQFDSIRVRDLVLSRLPGWDGARFDAALTSYRQFLELCRRNPGARVMCPDEADEVWHAHMLDSSNYRRDCNRIFGSYLDHDPCIGMRDYAGSKATAELFEQTFEMPVKGEWLRLMTCAKPGGGCGSSPVN